MQFFGMCPLLDRLYPPIKTQTDKYKFLQKKKYNKNKNHKNITHEIFYCKPTCINKYGKLLDGWTDGH